MDTGKFIRDYLAEQVKVTQDMSIPDIDKTIGVLYEAWRSGNRVYMCGNGGSASTATHFACDLAKSTLVPGKKRFKTECLNDNIPLVLALINDDGFDNLFYEQLRSKFQKGDVVICISVHGGAGKDKAGLWSQNLLKAMKFAQDNGGKAIGFSGFDGGPMKEIADACITIPVNSTPQVESFHLAMEHLICTCLRLRIEES